MCHLPHKNSTDLGISLCSVQCMLTVFKPLVRVVIATSSKAVAKVVFRAQGCRSPTGQYASYFTEFRRHIVLFLWLEERE